MRADFVVLIDVGICAKHLGALRGINQPVQRTQQTYTFHVLRPLRLALPAPFTKIIKTFYRRHLHQADVAMCQSLSHLAGSNGL
jgi:hypothetical protein